MRSTMLAIGLGVLCLAAASVLAAETAAAPMSGKSETYTGCLAQGDEAGEFKLTHVNGGAKEYELLGGKDLKDHVGHKVKIEGTLVSAKAAKSAEGEEAGENEGAHQHLRVRSMKHVAATCP